MEFQKILFKKELRMVVIYFLSAFVFFILVLAKNYFQNAFSEEGLKQAKSTFAINIQKIEVLEKQVEEDMVLKNKYQDFLINDADMKKELEKLLIAFKKVKVVGETTKLLDVISPFDFINVAYVSFSVDKPQTALTLQYFLKRIYKIKEFKNEGNNIISFEIYNRTEK